MKSLRIAPAAFAAAILALGVITPPAVAQNATFDAGRLEQLVAPIALYPDAILTQIFMAATYPTEIVEAERFIRARPDLSGTALENALAGQDWDPSVKALCGTREVLIRLSENLGWTRDLGEAFLGQRADLLDAVQRMRARARESGALKTTPQATVMLRDDRIIEIVSPDPEVVYVPVYSPTVVYGGWGFPSYYYPGLYAGIGFGGGFMTFGVGYGWGWGSWGRADWRWGGSDVFINVDRFNHYNDGYRFNRARVGISSNRPGGMATWQHDPVHRGGVGYRQPSVSRQYSGSSSPRPLTRDQTRGFHQPGLTRPSEGGRPSNDRPAGDRVGAGRGDAPDARPTPGRDRAPITAPPTQRQPSTERPVGNRQPAPPDRSSPPARQSSPGSGQSPSPRSSGEAPHSVWSGSRSPGFDRAATNRGVNSRGASSGVGAKGSAGRPRGGE